MASARSTALAVVIVVLALASCRMPTPGPTARSPEPSGSPSTTASPARPGEPTEPERFTPLVITVLAPDPVPVTGSDKRVHVVYELQVLNASPRPATITKVETLADNEATRVLSTLQGDQVTALSILVGDYTLPPEPAKVIPPGRSLLLIMDAVFADKTAVPGGLSHRITATYGAFEPNQGAFATNNFPARSVEVGGPVQVDTDRAPQVISAPLRGPDWVAVNGCCGLSPHRGAMVPVGGRINGAERYAVDWSKFDLAARPIVDFTKGTQATFRGDPTKNASYFTFGQPVHAALDGTVVTVVQDLPEAAPHTFLTLPLGDLGGNRVVIKHADGVYSFYAHLKTDSVLVRPGDRVQRGQQIAEAGNSGNTSESHLHFHLMDGPLPLTATNIAWVIDSFTYQGEVDPEKVEPAGAGPRTDEVPLINSAIAFPN